MSGKTTLARALAVQARKAGIGVLVLDPLCSTWECDFVTDNPDRFLQVFWASKNCLAIIDEAADCVGRYDDAMRATATRGRHSGHSVIFISQRGADLNLTVRSQCADLYLFTSNYRDCDTLALEFNCPDLKAGTQLKQGEYFAVGRYKPIKKYRIF